MKGKRELAIRINRVWVCGERHEGTHGAPLPSGTGRRNEKVLVARATPEDGISAIKTRQRTMDHACAIGDTWRVALRAGGWQWTHVVALLVTV